MPVTITGRLMSSPATRHTTRLTDAGSGGWKVTWLPGRALAHDQAVTAMMIAEVVATRFPVTNTDPLWGHIDSRAAELGLSGPNAVARTSESPEEVAARAAEEDGP